MIKDRDIAWVAGLYEGEGSVDYTPNTTINLRVGSTDLDVAEKLISIIGGNMHIENPSASTLGKKTLYRVKLNGKDAYAWLMMIYPFLSDRRRQQVDIKVKAWLSRSTKRGPSTQEAKDRMIATRRVNKELREARSHGAK